MNDSDLRFGDLDAAQRQAVLEKIAVTMERDAEWAGDEGDDALKMALQSVGSKILLHAGDLALSDVRVVENVAARAMGLISVFHRRHPRYPLGPTLH